MRTLATIGNQVAIAMILFLLAAAASAQDGQVAEFSYHDGIPSYQMQYGGGHNAVVGLFYYPTDSGRPYLISKVRFYHGGDYGDPESPRQFRIVVVWHGFPDVFDFVYVWPQPDQPALETTCNYCWEEVVIPYTAMPILFFPSTDEQGYGAFIYQETEEGFNRYSPYLWLDAETDYPMVTCAPEFDNPYDPSDWDIYTCTCSEIGDLLMEVEITYIDQIGTEETSFSTIKSLY